MARKAGDGHGLLFERRREAERAALWEALRKAAGNKAEAARILGCDRKTLYNMLDAHGAPPDVVLPVDGENPHT